MLPSAELPPYVPWFIVACVLVAIVAMVGLGITLRFVRELRTNVAEELRSELARAKDVPRMHVDQPLTVREHKELVTRDEHQELDKKVEGVKGTVEELKSDFDTRFNGFGRANAESREKIYVQLREQGQRLAENTAKTELTNNQVQRLDGKIDRILERLPR